MEHATPAADTHNLPLILSAFIGREKEMAEVTVWLATHRLVTLTGAGGCGKTRLALQIGKNLLPEFTGGVWLVDFSPLTNTELVIQITARVLRAPEQLGRTPLETLLGQLRGRRLLLIFDNCEHLVTACAQLAAALLQNCPNLYILATSRQPLGVTGEVVWSVPPLTLPPRQPSHNPAHSHSALSAYKESEAVQLFVARATSILPSFSLTIENGGWIAEICRHLDGIPLAIELAAARVRVLSAREIAQRLDDRFRLLTDGSRTALPRQQTLASTLDWSYRLLSNAEAAVLRRLAVFAGGCTLAAAEAVCADETIAAGDVLELTAHLVDKSLVIAEKTADGARYRLLETIRQYSLAKLLEAGQAEQTKARHCAYFVAWAQQANLNLQDPNQTGWFDRFETEHDNLRAALAWCRGDAGPDNTGYDSATHSEPTGDPARISMGLALVIACDNFWMSRANVGEGVRQIIATLATDKTQTDKTQTDKTQAHTQLRATALTILISLLFLRSDYPAMPRYAEEALTLWRSLGPKGRSGLARTLNKLGDMTIEEGDYARATLLLQEALAIQQELNEPQRMSNTLMLLGWAALRQGDYPNAAARLEESLALAQQTHHTPGIALALSGLGETALRQGDYPRAITLLEASLHHLRADGYSWLIATVLGSLGWVALLQHNDEQMRARLGESLTIRLQIGDQGGIAWCLEKLAAAALWQGEHAAPAARLERYQVGTRLYSAAAAIRAPLHSVIDQVDQPAYQHNLATLRAELGETAFATAWAEAETMGLNAAVTLGLTAPPETTPRPTPTTPYADSLTAREREVAILIAQGKSNREIAQAMTVREKTIETYITRILSKLAFHSRVQVAAWALQQELAPLPSSTQETESPHRRTGIPPN